MLKTVRFPEVSPIQREIIDACKIYKTVILAAGRQWGKSFIDRIMMVIAGLAKPRQTIVYCAPTYKLAKQMYKKLIDAPGFEKIKLKSAEQPTPWIQLKNGSVIHFFSLERPDKIRGFTVHFLIVDECRDISEYAWTSVLSPFVSATRGHILLTSTFRGKDHWFYQEYEKGLKPNTDSKSFLCPSKTGPRFQGPEGEAELARQKDRVGEDKFAVEFECVPIGAGDSVFKEAHIIQCTGALPTVRQSVTFDFLNTVSQNEPTLLGFDIGRIADPSSLVIVNRAGHILHTEVFKLKMDSEPQIEQVMKLAQQYRSTVIVETNGTNADYLVGLIKPRMPHGLRNVDVRNKNKEALISRLKYALERKKLTIPPSNKELLKQLRKYEVRKAGLHIDFHCPGGHDDLVIAMALCVHGLESHFLPDTASSGSGGWGF